MRVVITVAVWGRHYAAEFADYSAASLLAADNLPRLATRHQVSFHIVTTRADRIWLADHPSIKRLAQYCSVVWDTIEEHGIDIARIPDASDDRKYTLLSRLQNLAFAMSNNYDAIVFDYADFVWANGSLTATIEDLSDGAEAVLSFGLPIDRKSARPAIEAGRDPQGILTVSAPRLAAIACDHLHRDARLRFWTGPEFTPRPTYLLWNVGDQGLLIRAYHQTVLALRVKHDDPTFRRGIERGSLDGYFTSCLAADGCMRHATDSDRVLVVSLYDAPYSAVLRDGSREQALQDSLASLISPAQRRLAEIPIRVKARLTDTDAWLRAEEASGALIARMHETARFDATAFDLVNPRNDLENAVREKTVADWIYRRLLLRFAHTPLGARLRRWLGPSARSLRKRVEGWVYRTER